MGQLLNMLDCTQCDHVMVAGDTARVRRLIAEAKIEVKHVPATAAQDGLAHTQVLLRGNLKLEVLQPAPAAAGARDDRDDPNVSRSGPSAYDAASRSRFECDVDPEDPCATQEKDDVLAEATLVESSMQAYSDFANSTYADCVAEDICNEEFAKVMAQARAEHLSPDGSNAPTAEVAYGCGWEYVLALGGVAWGISAVTGIIVTTLSPEPVSKLSLVSQWANVVAGVSGAIGGVGLAYGCYQAQRVYDATESPLVAFLTPKLGVDGFRGATR